MPGAGLVESRALLGFLPALCRRLLGEDLKLPNVATWWCGQPQRARDGAERSSTELAIAPRLRRHRAAGFAAAAACSADLGAEAAQRARLQAAIRDRPGRLRRPGGGAAVDHAGLAATAGWSRGPSCCASSPPRRRTAGRSCPAASAASPTGRTRAPSRWARACSPPTSGSWPTGRSSATSLLPPAGRRADPPHPRQPAEPRRRQPVLARPLSRARRGDAAAGARPVHQPDRGRSRHPWQRRDAGPAAEAAGRLGRRAPTEAGRRRPAPSPPRPCTSRRTTARRSRWCARRGAPPPASASGCPPTSGRCWRAGGAAGASPARPSCPEAETLHQADRRPAVARRPVRPGAGEHEPGRRLALPRHGPAHRARHQHLPLRPPPGRAPTPPSTTSTLLLDLADSQITYRVALPHRAWPWRRCATW